ncbi:MAG: Na(+)/H(+) antiporter subunit D [Archaeoglobaceae archaeon]|nr:Na(+)/H(+) antiporter subunit D [Archaeoglobaceae archaeon]MDW7990356.1 Na(+)/H(+) antiporter subunit D [Archaeoglobaceae archaeon]
MIWIHPGILAVFGAFIIPFIPFRLLKKIYFFSLPLIAFLILILTTKGFFGEIPMTTWKIHFMGYDLILGRIDALSLFFAYVFAIIAICANIYSLHIKNDFEHVAAMIYFGSTIGAIFAGDLFTLYVFWETMAISSVFLIWFRGTSSARNAGFRYIIWHVISGSLLLFGIALHVQKTGSIFFTNFMDFINLGLDSIPYLLILLGFMINAAVIPFHSWLTDSYPEASITGATYMSAFTTKCAVYALVRGFAGLEILAWLGAVMAVYGVIFAAIVNDGRRLLSYHIVSQIGYMVCGIGLGTPLAINGAVALAFSNIIYKTLLFMGMGAVIEVTGKSKFTELGGLYRYMTLTFYLYMIGALSIFGFPLFSGFVSKPMVVYASAELHLPLIFLLLEGAAIGTLHTVGLRLPWSVWFSREKPKDLIAKEPPKNMLVAMSITAFLCVFFGTYPGYKVFYSILPYPTDYEPYEPFKVVTTIQLFAFTTLAFLIYRKKYRNVEAIVLDTDWLGRVLGSRFVSFCETKLVDLARRIDKSSSYFAEKIKILFTNPEMTYKSTKSNLEQSSNSPISRQLEMGIGILLTLLFMLVYLIYLILQEIF